MAGSRLGVMGGTFDPVHHGHLVAASEVASLFGLDEVVFVPTGEPWQKADRQVSHAEDRYLMTVIATASNPRFSVSRVDVDRGTTTYTIDTLTDLHRQRPDADLFFITGADALAQIVGWRDTEHLFDLAHFVGVTRPGYQLATADLPAGLPEDAVSLVEIPALAISSTDCRDRVRRGQPVWYLVPDGVVQYIEKRGLYRDGLPASPPGQLLPGSGIRLPANATGPRSGPRSDPRRDPEAAPPRSASPYPHTAPPRPTDGPGTTELQEIPR
ncbi:nicotinate-nucleotide adenylyltransferase [Klenkia sp. LSe6-5]|uniref:Probable nicotinate-nucleotide adenylyltransferase n=1 Tax=Klenkia sesuvii TaxID=3103137 RepID=A0ABU8DZZ7_9ACTN